MVRESMHNHEPTGPSLTRQHTSLSSRVYRHALWSDGPGDDTNDGFRCLLHRFTGEYP